MGVVIERTVSRMKRVRNIAFEQYERQIVKKQDYSPERIPSYLSNLIFKKDEDSKKLAKEILKGNYDTKDEEDMLDNMVYNLLNRSEKLAYVMQNKRNDKNSKNYHKTID